MADQPDTIAGPPEVGAEELAGSYRSLIEHHPHAVFHMDLTGRFTDLNPASQTISGYTARELLAMSFADVVEPDDLPAVTDQFELVTRGQARQMMLSIRRHTGEVAELDVTALPVFAQGQVRGVLALAIDVTKQRRQRRELALTREFAARAGAVKREFVLRMSHEIRTPLTSILATAEFLDTTALNEEQRDMVRTLRHSGERLRRLVDNVLDYSATGEDDSGPPLLEICDLHAIVRDAVDLVRATARLKGITVDLHIDPEIPRWVSDHPTWTTQVLVNLLSNAVTHTHVGGVHVSAAPTTLPGAGPGVLYRISDTGAGIDPEHLDTVFEPFLRSRAEGDERGGTGMGLSIVKQLVTISGGSVAVDSTLGRGTTFTVSMPARAAQAPVPGD